MNTKTKAPRVVKHYRYYSEYHGVRHTPNWRRALREHRPSDGEPEPTEVWAVICEGEPPIDCYTEGQARRVCAFLKRLGYDEEAA